MTKHLRVKVKRVAVSASLINAMGLVTAVADFIGIKRPLIIIDHSKFSTLAALSETWISCPKVL